MSEQEIVLSGNPFAKKRTITTDEFIIEEFGNGALTIGGYTVFGFAEEKVCLRCGCSVKIYDSDFDQEFCPICNVWEDPFCNDPTCKHCSGEHPSRPLPVEGEIDFPKRTGAGWSKLKFIGIDLP